MNSRRIIRDAFGELRRRQSVVGPAADAQTMMISSVLVPNSSRSTAAIVRQPFRTPATLRND